MKRIILFILLLGMLIASACTSANQLCDFDESVIDSETTNEATTNPTIKYSPYTAYIYLSDNMGEGASIEATEIFQSKKDADIKKPDNDELTITLMNKQYTGRFIRADVVSLDISAYIYETSDNTRFTVDVNGRIMEVLFPENFTYPVNFANPEKLLSKEEYIKSATEHLINILGEKEASRYEACNVSMNTNVIKVYFEANDIENGNFKLLDQIKIRLDDKGNILGFRGDYVGLYNNKVIPKDLSDNDVKKMIRESLVKSDVQIELSDNKTLVILSDGRMACNISFRLIEGDEAGGWERALIPLE